jgi:hypothetical protein
MPKDNTSVQQLSLINSDFLILPFRRNDRRQHAANASSHVFSGINEYRRNINIKSADGRIRRGEHPNS